MRRVSTVSILQQATLLADLLRHADAAALAHHQVALDAFFATVRDHMVVSHSVMAEIPPGEFRVPNGDRARALAILEAIVERRIKLALRA